MKEVFYHAFQNYQDGQDYCEPEDVADGWTVFTRTLSADRSEEFIWDEIDFATYEEAKAHAEARAALLGVVASIR
jgi:hypothetical protein